MPTMVNHDYLLITDRISMGGNALASDHLFTLYLLNRLTTDLELLHVSSHDHSSHGSEDQSQGSS